MPKIGSLVVREDERDNGVRISDVGPFRIQISSRGNQWDWDIHDSWFDTSIASGSAPTIEVAESTIEEIIGQRPAWHSRAA
jgi:hypothetical protein